MALIDVGKELSDHFERVKDLAETVADDGDETGSSKASVMNSLTKVLNDMAKIQNSLYTSESISQLQSAIVEALEESDQDLKDRVVEILERRLL